MNIFKIMIMCFTCVMLACNANGQYFPGYMKPQASGDKPLSDSVYSIEKSDQKSFEVNVKIKKDKSSDNISLWVVMKDSEEMIPIVFDLQKADENDGFKNFKIIFDFQKNHHNKSLVLPENAVLGWDAKSARKGYFYQFYYNYSHRLIGIYSDENLIGGVYLFNLEPRDEVNVISIPEELRYTEE